VDGRPQMHATIWMAKLMAMTRMEHGGILMWTCIDAR